MKRYLVIVAGLLAMIFQVGCSNDWVRTQYEDYRKRTAELDTETIVAALKQALEQGTHRGVSALGTVDGYWKNAKLRIPVPDNLAKVEKFVRKIGADKYADRFILSLNRAAEAAVPHAKAIFLEVIQNMTIRDAVGILRGPNDAATEYFRRHSRDRLAATFRPIVARATSKVGVTAHYKRFVEKAGRLGLVNARDLDLDQYVTDNALDGLYFMIAEEERCIRDDPVARTTERLKKVFQ